MKYGISAHNNDFAVNPEFKLEGSAGTP